MHESRLRQAMQRADLDEMDEAAREVGRQAVANVIAGRALDLETELADALKAIEQRQKRDQRLHDLLAELKDLLT